jgi:hypothetical protein
MEEKRLINGFIWLVSGLFNSSTSTFLEHFAIFGTGTDFIRGLFDGLAVVTFGVAIFALVRSRRSTNTK